MERLNKIPTIKVTRKKGLAAESLEQSPRFSRCEPQGQFYESCLQVNPVSIFIPGSSVSGVILLPCYVEMVPFNLIIFFSAVASRL